MEFLRLLPAAQSYSAAPSAPSVARVEVEGGFDVRRADLLGVTSFFSVTYVLDPEGLEYAEEFFRTYFAAPAWFHALLVGLPRNGLYPLQRFAVQVSPDTYTVEEVDGHRFAISMQLEGWLDDTWPTSSPYQRLFDEEIGLAFGMAETGFLAQGLWREEIGLAFSMDGVGELAAAFSGTYEWGPENLGLAFTMEGTGELRTVYIVYDEGEPEDIGLGFAMNGTGALVVVYILYDDAEPENMELAFGMTGTGALQ